MSVPPKGEARGEIPTTRQLPPGRSATKISGNNFFPDQPPSRRGRLRFKKNILF